MATDVIYQQTCKVEGCNRRASESASVASGINVCAEHAAEGFGFFQGTVLMVWRADMSKPLPANQAEWL